MTFVVKKVAQGQIFSRENFGLSLPIVPPMLHAHLHLYTTLDQKDKRIKLGNLWTKQCRFGLSESIA